MLEHREGCSAHTKGVTSHAAHCSPYEVVETALVCRFIGLFVWALNVLKFVQTAL